MDNFDADTQQIDHQAQMAIEFYRWCSEPIYKQWGTKICRVEHKEGETYNYYPSASIQEARCMTLKAIYYFWCEQIHRK